ncbi:MAG: MBL fold metallo-hydrolase [Candidatus Omnitrophica bacterium]|nr:MBL fold metallo-hydrolase [Candidatus Omnitrophota bacterium]
MKFFKTVFLFFLVMGFFMFKPEFILAKDLDVDFIPINHASFIINSAAAIIYIDPVGDVGQYREYPAPDMILITHSHQDHLDSKLVNQLKQENTLILGPEDVIKQLGFGAVLTNLEQREFKQILVQAVPMYNTTADRLQFHQKAKGNGYIITLLGKRIYITGDTEDIPEMRQLKNIDYAFICMNLPYTMTVEQAASAVLEFKPKVVFPYHYKGPDGYSDLEGFRALVSVDKSIEVRLENWYKN